MQCIGDIPMHCLLKDKMAISTGKYNSSGRSSSVCICNNIEF